MNPDVHKLLRLKRYERPSSDYFERFLDEFHERQRADLLQQSVFVLMRERLAGLFANFYVPRPVYAGVAVAAVILSAAILVTQQGGDGLAPSTLALNTPNPVVNVMPPVQRVVHLPEASRSEFPPHYVLESRPVSYESPYSF